MTRRRKLIWQLYPSFLIVILAALLAVSGYTISALREFSLKQTESDLLVQGKLLEKQMVAHLVPLNAAAVDRICKATAEAVPTRLTVILPNGEVIGDSEKDPATMDNHRNRPEMATALAGRVGMSVRYSDTLKKNMMYVALPLMNHAVNRGMNQDEVKAVLRTSIALTAIDAAVRDVRIRIAVAGLLMAVLVSILCYWISRRITRPIEEMKDGAQQFAEGALTHRLRLPDTMELAALAEALNNVAVQLQTRMETVVTQRNEYEAVLSSMVEGVIAVDREERILSINQAAVHILNLVAEDLKGRSIQEVSRSRDLHKFVHATLVDGKVVEGDIMLYQEEERIVNAQSIPLCDAGDRRIGTLLVLNDVTQLRRLEIVRRDFVANVSHEIKTPLTAIKGFVETMLHDGMDNRADAERFLKIVNKHVDRLSAIVEDLLSLARIEKQNEGNELRYEKKPLKQVLASAVQVVQPKADAKDIHVDIECPDDLTLKLDPTLMDQALVNLVDNAVKYSPDHSRVMVQASVEDSDIIIQVIDHGSGISLKHLPRLFERFYRVDKSRSRNMGGTGLGLSIVKHILQAHGGKVSVESEPGKGSTFTLHLPMDLWVP